MCVMSSGAEPNGSCERDLWPLESEPRLARPGSSATLAAALEIPDVMRTLSHVTPHAWAMDAFHRLLLEGGGLGQVLTEVGVLLGFAVVLMTIATFRFRRAIAG
jgi:hypothetical protein